MNTHKSIFVLGLGAVLILFAGCKQAMVISEVDYSQPIETVLVPDDKGVVNDVQHGLTFNILPLQYEETQDSSMVTTDEIRMIRGKEGYYYITASGYANVYVMAPEKSRLKLMKKINVAERGISEPAFNQRNSFIQLLNRQTNETYSLTAEGLRENQSNQDEEANEEAK